MEGNMVGVLPVETTNLNLQLPTALLEALDRYRATLDDKPSRSFLIRHCISEYLKRQGVNSLTIEEADSMDQP